MSVPKFNHDLLGQAIQEYSKLDEVKNKPELLKSIQWQIERWSQGIYLLVVLGEVKKGKSSFINALLGQEALSPVADKVVTAVPYKIIYGEEIKYRIHFLPEDPAKPETCPDSIEVTADEVIKYGTETGLDSDNTSDNKGNYDNRYNVNFISVEHPHPLLKEGLVIIDLPGLGGLFEKHSHLVWEYLDPERVDHVAFIIDSAENPFAQAESDTISRLKKRRIDRFFFIQTKSDVADSTKVEIWKERNLTCISELLGKEKSDISYFLGSSEYKQQANKTGDQDYLESSGFPEIEDYINNNLMVNKKEVLAAPLGVGLLSQVTNMEAHAIEKLSIYLANSKEKKETIELQLKKSLKDFQQWGREILPSIERTLNHDLDMAAVSSRDMLAQSLDSSRIVEPVMDEIIMSLSTEEEVMNNARVAESSCVDICLSRFHEASFEYKEQAGHIFLEAQKNIGETIPSPPELEVSDSISGIKTATLQKKSSNYGTFRSTFYGNALGGGAAYTAATVLSLSIPLVGVAVLIGGLYGARKSYEVSKKQDFDSACQRLKNNLVSASRQAAMEVRQNMDKYARVTKRNMLSNIQEAARHLLEDLKENVEELKQSKLKTEQEFLQRRQQLQSALNNIRTVKTLLLKAGFNIEKQEKS